MSLILRMYFLQIPSDRELCVEVQFEREHNVDAVQVVPVKVYDYFKPGQIWCQIEIERFTETTTFLFFFQKFMVAPNSFGRIFLKCVEIVDLPITQKNSPLSSQ